MNGSTVRRYGHEVGSGAVSFFKRKKTVTSRWFSSEQEKRAYVVEVGRLAPPGSPQRFVHGPLRFWKT